MYGMDNEEYRNGIIEFIKHLTEWRSIISESKREPLLSYRYPKTTVSVYIHTYKIYYCINMYRLTHKSKWISKYCDLITGIKETEMSCVYKRIRGYNNVMAKLITRKRGIIR